MYNAVYIQGGGGARGIVINRPTGAAALVNMVCGFVRGVGLGEGDSPHDACPLVVWLVLPDPCVS